MHLHGLAKGKEGANLFFVSLWLAREASRPALGRQQTPAHSAQSLARYFVHHDRRGLSAALLHRIQCFVSFKSCPPRAHAGHQMTSLSTVQEAENLKWIL